MGEVVNISMRIDFLLLRSQKNWLLCQEDTSNEIEGLLGIIDSIQDAAVEQGVPVETVFGKVEEESLPD